MLDGKTPSEAFAEHVNAGWSAAIIDPLYLNSVFSRPVTRKLIGGRFDLDGREGGWNCPELDRHLEDTIVVHVPIYHDYNEVDVFTLDGRRLGVASPQEVFTFGDQRGAQHSARRKNAYNTAIRQLGKSAPKIDAAALIVAHGEDQMPILPNSPRAVVTIDANSRPASVIIPEGKPAGSQKDRQRERVEITAIREQNNLNVLKMRAAR